MRTRVLLAAALVACSGARAPRTATGEELVSFEGKVERGPYRFGKDDLRQVPRRSFLAVPPDDGKEATFEGASLADLLGDVMDLPRDADTAVFHGERGYAVAVPVAALRQIRPVLADRVDGAPLARSLAGAGPLLLAWPNVEQPGIETDPRMRWWWVRGVRKVELVAWTATYGKALRVPPGADDQARLGADALATACLGCHRLRGVGGTRGPELKAALLPRGDGPVSLELHDHLRKVSGASAPEVAPGTAREIAAFLRAAEIAAARGEEEIAPPEPPPPLPMSSPRPPGRM